MKFLKKGNYQKTIFLLITFMLDTRTKNICKDNPEIRDLKIKNIEHAIIQAEKIIRESKMSQEELVFLKRKITESKLDLEMLYLMKN